MLINIFCVNRRRRLIMETIPQQVIDEYISSKSASYPFPCRICSSNKVFVCNQDSAFVECRSCRGKFRNCKQKKESYGHEMSLSTATGLLNEILDTFKANRDMLQDIVKEAKGRMLVIMEVYTPKVIDLCIHAIQGYGFSKDIFGVMCALRSLQQHNVKKIRDGVLEIRKILCPTGQWIQLDKEQLQQEEFERLRFKEQEEARESEENNAMAFVEKEQRENQGRLRKLELGLDPDKIYEPIVRVQPKSTVSLIGESAYFRIECDHVLTYRWSSKKLIHDREGFMKGSQSPFLRLLKVNSDHFGEYICTVRNDDGVAITNTCTLTKANLIPCQIEQKHKSRVIEQIIFCGSGRIALRDLSHLTLYDISTGEALSDEINALSAAWCPSTDTLAVGLENGSVQIRRLTSGDDTSSSTQLKQRVCAPEPMRFVAFTHDGGNFAVRVGDYRIKLYDTQTLSLERTIKLREIPTTIAFNPKHPLLTITLPTCIRTYDLSTQLVKIEPYRSGANLMIWNDAGTHFALCEKGLKMSAISIVKADTRKEVLRFEAHIGTISCCTWACNGRLILSAGQDGYIRCWGPLPKTDCLSSIRAHVKRITSISLSSDHLFSASFDKKVKIWRIPDLAKLQHQFHWRDGLTAGTLQRIVRGFLVRTRIKRAKQPLIVEQDTEVMVDDSNEEINTTTINEETPDELNKTITESNDDATTGTMETNSDNNSNTSNIETETETERVNDDDEQSTELENDRETATPDDDVESNNSTEQ